MRESVEYLLGLWLKIQIVYLIYLFGAGFSISNLLGEHPFRISD